MKQTMSSDHNTASAEQASFGVGDTLLHPMQRKIDGSPRQRTQQDRLAQLQSGPAPERPDGLPGALRSGIEAMSGMDMGDVVVHRNSARPAQLNALAYAQGSEIHLGPGQEKHLPHEAWHVVQQRQGRVKATTQAKSVPVNDDQALEREADTMGASAARWVGSPAQMQASTHATASSSTNRDNGSGSEIVQRVTEFSFKSTKI